MQLTKVQKTIVVPFDYSEMSCQALARAVEMVDDPSLIRVVHVTEYPSAYEYGIVWETMTEDTIVAKLKEAFQEHLDKMEAMPELSFTVMFGNPGKEICNFAKDIDSELIVMPSHGRSGFARFVLGSVAERVVRFAPCPVLILRDDSAEKAADAQAPLANVVI